MCQAGVCQVDVWARVRVCVCVWLPVFGECVHCRGHAPGHGGVQHIMLANPPIATLCANKFCQLNLCHSQLEAPRLITCLIPVIQLNLLLSFFFSIHEEF